MKQRNGVAKTASAPKNASRPVTQEGPGEYAPTFEEICKRAFEIHVERGGFHGSDLDDWLQAERELQEEYAKSGKTTPSQPR